MLKKFDQKSTIFIISAIIFLLLPYNFNIPELAQSVLIMWLIPILIAFFLGFKAEEIGITIGNYKSGFLWTIILIIVFNFFMVLGLFIFPDTLAYYEILSQTPNYWLYTIISIFSLEFLLRGYLLLGLSPKIGFWQTNIIQTLLFAAVHIGKPWPETFSTLVTGLFFGWLAFRGRSFIYPFILHVSLNVVLFVILNA